MILNVTPSDLPTPSARSAVAPRNSTRSGPRKLNVKLLEREPRAISPGAVQQKRRSAVLYAHGLASHAGLLVEGPRPTGGEFLLGQAAVGEANPVKTQFVQFEHRGVGNDQQRIAHPALAHQ